MSQSSRSSQAGSSAPSEQPILGPFSGDWEQIKPRPTEPKGKEPFPGDLPENLHDMSALYLDLLTGSKDDERIRRSHIPPFQTVERQPQIVDRTSPEPSQGQAAGSSLHHPLSFVSRIARGEQPGIVNIPHPTPAAAPITTWQPQRAPQPDHSRCTPALRRVQAVDNLARQYKKGEESQEWVV